MSLRFLKRIRFAHVIVAMGLAGATCAWSMPQQNAGSVQTDEGHKSQSELASKDSFMTIPANNPLLKTALKATDNKGALAQIGKQISYTGKIVSVYTPKGNSLILLDFTDNYKDSITAVVHSKDYANFPDLKTLRSKTVLVTGVVSAYHTFPQVTLNTKDQIKIVQ